MEHLHFRHYDRNTQESFEVDLFQSAKDVLTVGVKNVRFSQDIGFKLFDIPVKKNSDVVWKCNKTSVSCQTGDAADLIELFKNFSITYAIATVRHIIFENPKNRAKVF